MIPVVGRRWILVPSIVVGVWLAISAVPSFEWTKYVAAWFGFMYFPLLIAGLVVVRIRSEHDDAGFLAICAQAPLALMPKWTDDGALHGYLEALREGVEIEELVGIAGLLICALLPVVVAWRHAGGTASRAFRASSLAVYMIVWGVVIATIDWLMIFGGLLSCCGVVWHSTGALIRLIVFGALLGLAVKTTRGSDVRSGA